MAIIFFPSREFAGSKLAPSIYERVTVLLRPFRNRLAAYKLAVWLAKMNAGHNRLMLTFPIDRRSLAKREDLGLTENQIRGAIETLKRIGFIVVVPAEDGDIYQQVEIDNVLAPRRRAIQYRFAEDYWVIFAFMAGLSGYSPRGRHNNKLENIYRRFAPSLGEKGSDTGADRASSAGSEGKTSGMASKVASLFAWGPKTPQNAPQAANKRLRGQKAPIPADSGVDGALARLQARFQEAQRRKLEGAS